VIIPEENRKDLAEIPRNVTQGIEESPVRWIDEVLDIALERPLVPHPARRLRRSRPSRSASSNPCIEDALNQSVGFIQRATGFVTNR